MGKTLSAEVAEKYKLVGIAADKYQFAGFGTIDLCSISLDRADALVAAGFKYLVKKDKKEKGA